jgi:hypothetical protein
MGNFSFGKKRVVACLLGWLRSVTRGVHHTVMALPFTLKSNCKAKKEELTKTQIFHHAKI